MAGYLGNIPVPQATQTREVFTATASQTSFATAGYPVGFVDVWLNGVKLINGTDFTATNGSDVVLTVGAAAGDTVEVISNSTFEVNSQTFTGGLTVNNDGATVLTVDRATSTGKIVDVKNSGTSVGSVGVHSGFITLGSGDTSLIFDSTSNTIEPFNQSDLTAEDAAITLGWSSNRFKNLYLSGGVYLGGTGAANLLDDYEEGTWTPTVSVGTVSATSATYTKVGRLVTINCQLSSFSDRTSSSAINIGGLPFGASGAFTGPTLYRYFNVAGGGDQLSIYIASGATQFNFYSCVNGGIYVLAQHAHLNNAAAYVFVTFSYLTNA